jgi:hypothetical protein
MSPISKNNNATNVKKVCDSQELGSLLSPNSFTQVQTTHYMHKLTHITHINWQNELKRKCQSCKMNKNTCVFVV